MNLGTGAVIHVGLACQEAEIDEQWSYVSKKVTSAGFGMQLTMRLTPFWLMFLEGEKMRFSKSSKSFLNHLVSRNFTLTIGGLMNVISTKTNMSLERKIPKKLNVRI